MLVSNENDPNPDDLRGDPKVAAPPKVGDEPNVGGPPKVGAAPKAAAVVIFLH